MDFRNTNKSSFRIIFFVLFFLFCSFSLSNSLCCAAPPEPFLADSTRPFCLMSIPKSGTHLNAKLLVMLTNRTLFTLDFITQIHEDNYSKFENFLLNLYTDNKFVRCHTYRQGTYSISRIHNFVCDHQEYLAILAIRDLRDVIVSYAFFASETLNSELGPNHTIDDRLEHILSGSGKVANNLINCLDGAIQNWLSLPNVLIVRFEDLIGANGEGSDLLQKEAIEKIATSLNITLREADLQELCEKLFGVSNGPHVSETFREGKIGSWKKYFKPHHIKLFKERWAKYQYALGYSLNGME